MEAPLTEVAAKVLLSSSSCWIYRSTGKSNGPQTTRADCLKIGRRTQNRQHILGPCYNLNRLIASNPVSHPNLNSKCKSGFFPVKLPAGEKQSLCQRLAVFLIVGLTGQTIRRTRLKYRGTEGPIS